MAETKRMTTEQVVGYLLEGEGLDSGARAPTGARLRRLIAVRFWAPGPESSMIGSIPGAHWRLCKSIRKERPRERGFCRAL
jgi:hypothetical protein